ncbi:hypothetical protein KQH81_03375 [Clostridium cadaveris]|uniref:hypothetical protein n=1 Tax=Clostridium cadaveris TaxID=1529 RepID=UPI001E4B5655|nr:hypothetical protein [Clostridium cadaveris]UFH65594.1 hypothetical protein KQH81_03375 [Clostridium cadaveris]
MAEERKALIDKIILKYPHKNPIEIVYNGDDKTQLDMQLFTEQLLKCKYNGFSLQAAPGMDYEINKVSAIEFVFKPKY